jgi:hypothetical protein
LGAAVNEWVKQTNIKGPPGIQGEPGPGIRFMGTVPTFADLPTDAEPGDMWNADDTGHSWTWNGEEWIDGGSSRGADGPPNVLEIGTVTTVPPGGAATAEITGTSPSQTLNLGIPRGDKGDPGVPGVATVSATAPASPVQGQMWWNSTTKTLMIREGTVWQPVLGTWA